MDHDNYRWLVAAIGIVVLWFSTTIVVNAVMALIGGGGGDDEGDEEEGEEEGEAGDEEGRRLTVANLHNFGKSDNFGPSLNIQSLYERE